MSLELTVLTTAIAEVESGLNVEMTLADASEAETALNLVQFRVLLDTHVIAAPFVRLQTAALQHVQSAIGAEILRLKQREANSP